MIDFLAGVPGKLKTLVTLLNSTWAAKLDALRTGLTDTRMGYLDKLSITGNVASSAEAAACAQTTDPMLNIPTLLCLGATTVVDQWSTTNYGWMAPAAPVRAAAATTTSYTDVLNVSGKGVLEMVVGRLQPHATSTGQIQILIDGVLIWDSGTIPNASNYFSTTAPVGTLKQFYNGTGVSISAVPCEGIPYRTSCQVKHKLVASGSTLDTYVRARRSYP